MAYEQKTNTGTMQRVPDEKRTSDRFPEFGGKLAVTCQHCNAEQHWWLSAWVKESKFGRFFSISLKPREERQEQSKSQWDSAPAPRPAPAPQVSRKNPIADEIPF